MKKYFTGKLISAVNPVILPAIVSVLFFCLFSLNISAYAQNMPVSITSFEIFGGQITGINITAAEDAPESFYAAAAVYNSDSELIGLEISSISEISSEEAKTLTLNPLDFTDEYTAKGFIFKADENSALTAMPYADVYVYSPQPSGDGIIHLNGDSADITGIENVTYESGSIIISAAGSYIIEGTLNDGQIIVNTPEKKDEVEITLQGVSIYCSYSAPMNFENGKVTLALADGTENSLSDADEYIYESEEDDEPNACLFSKRDLTIEGGGSLTVTANYNNGIASKADLKIKEGTINVTAANHGLKGNDSVTVQGSANVVIIAGNDGIQSDTDDEEDCGNVTVKGGILDITASGDGIQAYRTLSVTGGTITIDSVEDALKANGEITDETLDSQTVGVISISGGDTNIESDQDGIQAENYISISDGGVTVTSLEDALNCSLGNIDITGGTFNITSTQDAVQAEMALNISAGDFTIVTGGGYNGPSTEESCKALKGTGSINITGGTFNINSRDDSVHSNGDAVISGGEFTVWSGDDGMHADTSVTISSEPVISIKNCYEGIEAVTINISGGNIHINSSDDGINAAGGDGSNISGGRTNTGGNPGGGGPGGGVPGQSETSDNGSVNITGGYIVITAAGDGLDSNGSVVMDAGTVIINGPTANDNGALDYDTTFTLNGGTLIAAGSSGMALAPSASSVYGFFISYSSTQSANNIIAIRTSSDEDVLVFAPSKNYQNVVIYSPELTSQQYKIYSGGTYSAESTDGIYSGGTYTPGTLKTTAAASTSKTNTSIR